MKATLIAPAQLLQGRFITPSSQCLGILYLASALESAGVEANVIDAAFAGRFLFHKIKKGVFLNGLSDEALLNKIDPSSLFIGISTSSTYSIEYVHQLIDKIKNHFPTTPVILGGIYPSSLPQLALSSRADYIAMGEAEESLVDFLDFLNSNKDLPAGIYSKESNTQLVPRTVKELDTLHYPLRSKIPLEKYRSIFPNIKNLDLVTSRGCPYSCNFCSIHSIGTNLYRMRSEQNVLDEIDFLTKSYRFDQVNFLDDNFTLNKKRTMALLKGFEERFPNHSWCNTNGIRIDTLDSELIESLKKSRCNQITIALEHGSQKLLDRMNKGYNLNKALDVIGELYRHKIPTFCNVILGYPGETREIFEESIQFLRKVKEVNPDVTFLFITAKALPATALFAECLQNKYLERYHYNDIEGAPILEKANAIDIITPDFDQSEIMKRLIMLNKLFSPRIKYYKAYLNYHIPPTLLSPFKSLYRRVLNLWTRLFSIV